MADEIRWITVRICELVGLQFGFESLLGVSKGAWDRKRWLRGGIYGETENLRNLH